MPTPPAGTALRAQDTATPMTEPFAFASDTLGMLSTLPLLWSIPLRATMVVMGEYVRETGGDDRQG